MAYSKLLTNKMKSCKPKIARLQKNVDQKAQENQKFIRIQNLS